MCLLALFLGFIQAPSKPKVVVLGFDGVDAGLTRQWIESGHLPHLAQMASQGSFLPLSSPIPAQTPVSWSSFATGLDPGQHRVFNFLQRRPGTYLPEFVAWDRTKEPFPKAAYLWQSGILGALVFAVIVLLGRWVSGKGSRFLIVGGALIGGLLAIAIQNSRLPSTRPVFHNRQVGTPFWQRLGEEGIQVQLFRMPVSFPAKPFPKGKLLAGLGTPDLSLRIGKPFFFTSELFFKPFSGRDSPVEVVSLSHDKGRITTAITGPVNPWSADDGDNLITPLVLTVAGSRDLLHLEWNQRQISLKPGQWSEVETFAFYTGIPSRTLTGMGRFKLIQLKDQIQLYLSPLSVHPDGVSTDIPMSHPMDHAAELLEEFGSFKTTGWPYDTWSPGEGTLGLADFLEDVATTRESYEAMLYGALDKGNWDLLFHYFEFTDRVQHLFWSAFDDGHPGFDPEEATTYGDVIPQAYRHMDRIVGETQKRMAPDDILMIVSDHGFTSFRRTISYNAWLAREGYLRMKGEGPNREGLELLLGQGSFFRGVDWRRTQAYALGMGQIYVNLRGREKEGIVNPGEEYDVLCRDITEALLNHKDPDTGLQPVKRVVSRDQIYREYQPNLVPDLLPLNHLNYRVGWDDSLGGVPKLVHQDNLRRWSGDHATVDPALLPGVLLCNRLLSSDVASMEDLAPTLLSLFGVSHELPGRTLIRP